MRLKWTFAPAALLICLVPATASAATENCRAIANPQQRLACYDAREDQSSQERAGRRKANFGLADKQRAPEDRTDAVDAVSSKIVQVSGSRVVLENGAVWQFDRDSRMIFWVRPGQDITVKKGVLGGYRASVKGVNGLDPVTRVH